MAKGKYDKLREASHTSNSTDNSSKRIEDLRSQLSASRAREAKLKSQLDVFQKKETQKVTSSIHRYDVGIKIEETLDERIRNRSFRSNDKIFIGDTLTKLNFLIDPVLKICNAVLSGQDPKFRPYQRVETSPGQYSSEIVQDENGKDVRLPNSFDRLAAISAVIASDPALCNLLNEFVKAVKVPEVKEKIENLALLSAKEGSNRMYYGVVPKKDSNNSSKATQEQDNPANHESTEPSQAQDPSHQGPSLDDR